MSDATGVLVAFVWRQGPWVTYLAHEGAHPDLELDADIRSGGDWEDANVLHEEAPPMPPQEAGLWRLDYPWRTTTAFERNDLGELCCIYTAPATWTRIDVSAALSGEGTGGAASLTFDELHEVNLKRCARWHPRGLESWSLSDWAVAFAGEVGEACNVIKKLNRERDGLTGNSVSTPELLTMLAKELADSAIYLDLLASRAGINLADAIVSKFNEVSERNSFPERLRAAVPPEGSEERRDAERLKRLDAAIEENGPTLTIYCVTMATDRTDPNTGEHYEVPVTKIFRGEEQVAATDKGLGDAIDLAFPTLPEAPPLPSLDGFDLDGFGSPSSAPSPENAT